jgi:hypothetical protein
MYTTLTFKGSCPHHCHQNHIKTNKFGEGRVVGETCAIHNGFLTFNVVIEPIREFDLIASVMSSHGGQGSFFLLRGTFC